MKTNNKLTVLCDLDDVLWDITPTWCELYNGLEDSKFKLSVNDLTNWDISKIVGEEESIKFHNLLKEDSFWDKVVSNQDKIHIKKNYNHLKWLNESQDVFIVTATNYTNKHKLDLFFQIYDFLSPKKLILIQDKWLLDADIIIDDRAETLYEFDKKKKRCVKINKPWNYWFNCEGYNTFYQAVDALLNTQRD